MIFFSVVSCFQAAPSDLCSGLKAAYMGLSHLERTAEGVVEQKVEVKYFPPRPVNCIEIQRFKEVNGRSGRLLLMHGRYVAFDFVALNLTSCSGSEVSEE
jgi:hypothetical protein